MRDLFDSIKESLLDDTDEFLSKMDKVVGGAWFEKNAKGNFKIKDKKSSIGCTIVGDIVFDKYDGEEIPVSVWKVQKGSIYFTNCPNLKSVRGFFGEYPGTLDGGLFIENCPNLESLEGCPAVVSDFSCIGNRKIKSLEGAPKHVFGNCYVMKNGKKFTEEYIRSLIEVTDRIDCNEEEIEANLNEAFTEPHLLKLAEYLKTQKSSFGKLFGNRAGVAFDKITSKDVQTFRYPRNIDDGVKAANQIISGKASGFVVVLDKQDKFEMLIYGKNYINLSPGYSFGRSGHAKSTELLDICKHAGEIMVFRLTQDFQTWKLQSDRKEARAGMLYAGEKNGWGGSLRDEQNMKIAKENIERYKKIIAQNRANRDKDFEEIDKQVESIIMRVLKASQISHRNPEKITDYQVSRLNEWIYDEVKYSQQSHKSYGKTGLLRLYNKFTDYLADVKKGNAYDFQIEGLQKVKKEIFDTINKIDAELKALGL